MNPKLPIPPSSVGPVSKSITNAVKKAAASGSELTPDGFPGPTTIMFITARTDTGPAPKHIIELIHVLKKSGLRIIVASPSNPPFGFELKKLADRFILIPNRKFSFATLWYLRKQIKKNKINIVHSHGRTAGVYSRLLGKITKAAIMHTPHGFSAETGLSGRFKMLIEGRLAELKYEAVFASENERLKSIEVGATRKKTECHVIENPINLSKYPARKHACLALSKVEPSNPDTYSKIKIGAFLRPESTRGHNAFLKIAKEAASVAEFTCIGMARADLVKYGTIPPNLEVLGPVADSTSWLYSLDIFVSTSTVDGQVVGANEAIAAGAICLLSKIAPHERFHTNQAAVLFDAKSTESFMQALNSLVHDRSMRDMLLGNSRYMLERFNDEDSFRVSYLDAYRSIVKRAAGLIL
jgi:glycosyltransferase involved in cell wall biosynthesis